VLVMIVVAIIFYRKGKGKTTLTDLPTEGLNASTGNGGVNLSGVQVSTNDLIQMAADMHEDINCIFCTRNSALYERVAALSDTDLGRLYNMYNTKYQAQDKETMLQALQGELTGAFSTTFAGNVKSIISRLEKYNLK